jgi:hypothetical protein
MKTKLVEYTCPSCGHKWNRTIRLYEGSLRWNEDEKQPRVCTACDALRRARVHEAAAINYRTKARNIFEKRKARKQLTEA